MVIHVHVVCWNEADLVPWICAHYSRFASHIFFHDNFSDDDTRSLISHCPIAEVVDYDTKGEVRDDLLLKLKNTCWKQRGADWVICCDADEFVYIAGNPRLALADLEASRVAMPQCHWIEMVGDAIPRYTSGSQLYDFIQKGVVKDPTKSLLFNSQAVREIRYTWGAHSCSPILADGWQGSVNTRPPVYALHFKYARGAATVRMRAAAMAARLSSNNRRHGLGSHWLEGHSTKYTYTRLQAAAQPIEFLANDSAFRS